MRKTGLRDERDVMTTSRHQPFHLLRRFSGLSLLCIAVIAAGLSLLLSRFLTDTMVKRDAQVTMQFVQSLAQINDPSDYFVQQTPTQAEHAYQPQEQLTANRAALEEFFAHIVAMPEVVRANVYNDDKRVVWSSQSHLVGRRFEDNPELQRALTGRLTVKMGSVRQHRKAEHVDFSRDVVNFVENYIPIWDKGRRRVLGVVEVYRLPQALFEAIARGHRLVWGSALLGGLFLYVTLFGIVRRAARVIERQHVRLVEAETLVALGEMGSALAHNLRNPLASIRSSAEVLIETETDELHREIARDVIALVDRMEQWIRELLTSLRPVEHAPEAVRLDRLLQDLLQGLEPDLAQHHIRLEPHLTAELPVVHADAQLLQQALQSLVVNAIEAMPEGGTLTVSAGQSADRRRLHLRISDTGTGIPGDQLGQVFKPFFTTKSKGLGVGLALTRRIVERHGGSIELHSEPGQGTRVDVWLPVTE